MNNNHYCKTNTMKPQKNEQFLKQIKDTVTKTDPSAKIYLFGSRARGDAREDSDWDFLILDRHSKIPLEIQRKYRYPLYEIEWETGQVISTVIVSESKWEDPVFQVTPFFENIKKEGIIL
ncbi:MAG: nucleotidyltransferase domain-containing protein [Bacteroidales bacterium]|nr:nucleotidyltransferase domain-containing protein [Bacteroidales bacterium]